MAALPFPLNKNGVIQDWHVVSKIHYLLMRLGLVDEPALVPEVVKLVNTAPLTKFVDPMGHALNVMIVTILKTYIQGRPVLDGAAAKET